MTALRSRIAALEHAAPRGEMICIYADGSKPISVVPFARCEGESIAAFADRRRALRANGGIAVIASRADESL